MKHKGGLLAICFIICLFSIANASASDMNDDILAGNNDLIEKESTISTEILSANPDGTFTDLANEIASATDELNLTRNYVYTNDDSIYQDGIDINKSIAINGNGFAIIKNNSKATIFNVKASSVTLRDISFANSFGDECSGIYWTGDKGIMTGCSFVNWTDVGAVDWFAANGSIMNCIFMNCHTVGSTIFVDNEPLTITNCTFINNHGEYQGGAVCGRTTVVNCTFINNSAEYGGAMFNGICINSTFKNNHAREGGAIYNVVAYNSLFECNSAENGGAMSEGTTDKCTFNCNTATDYGGAIYSAKVSTSSKFNNNNAPTGKDTYNVTWFDRLDGKTFTDLKNLIEKSGSDIYLNDNYAFNVNSDFSFIDGITVGHAVTVYGNGYTISGNNAARIFNVELMNGMDGEVVFKDIIFKNGNSYDGGAIKGHCTAVNCSFEGNYAGAGGAMAYGSAVNCTFINNYADHGGAISFGSAVNCSFVNNTADSGGAMAYGSAVNCTFIGNFAEAYGGSMYVSYPVNCTFINNTAIYGGAMASSSAVNCTFMGNIVPKFGGAAYSCKINSCIFKGKSTGMGDNDVFPKLVTFLTTKYDRDTKKIVAVVKDEDGNAVSGVKVGFACNGVKYFVTDANGQAIFPTSSLSGGSNAVKVMAYGNNLYYNSNQETVTVTKEQAKIYLRNALYFVTQTKMVQVTLWDANNQPLSNKTVYIRAYNSVWHGVTDENGDAYIRVGIGFGTHDATVSFDGDDQYGSSAKAGYIRVIKQTPSVMVRGADSQFNASDNNKVVKVHLRDRYNQPLIANSKIVLKLNGKTYIGFTDINGVASIKININTVGTFTAQAMYGGNSAFNAVTRDIKIKII